MKSTIKPGQTEAPPADFPEELEVLKVLNVERRRISQVRRLRREFARQSSDRLQVFGEEDVA